ncbi:uncharacterized protein LOC111400681 [Olea europaea var. sylvestris]|uniref:uncharacterized protein LOC111400681 n=1 Tax=Olea europaea var. sylvestris TaxID=158386 RepID=UPI000C1CF66B|nr:uncharacterized protein LOC111400681 [Olea europaea var. sylvestris]
MPPIPFPQKLKKNKQDTNYEKFIDVLKKLQINVPFIDAHYTKYLKEMLTKKRKLPEFETVALTEESSTRVHRKLPPKLKNPGSFILSISIGNFYSINALYDTGANINLMSYSAYRKLGLGKVNSTSITLQLADRTIARPRGKVKDVLVKVENLILPVDFIVLDIPEDRDIPIILGRPFLAMGRTLIDMNMISRNTQTNMDMEKMGQISSLEENVEEESIKRNTKTPQHHSATEVVLSAQLDLPLLTHHKVLVINETLEEVCPTIQLMVGRLTAASCDMFLNIIEFFSYPRRVDENIHFIYFLVGLLFMFWALIYIIGLV